MYYSVYSGVEAPNHRVRNYIIAFLSIVAVTAGFAVPAIAAGNEQSSMTVGNCISDGVYGNEPNMSNGAPGGPAEQEPGSQAGNVVPSQSPGPYVNNPNDPDNPTRGRSVGQLQQDGINAPEICRTLTQ
jgi:hypothetical protein